jgi:repressor LexA
VGKKRDEGKAMTERQRLVLEFIETYIKMKGFAPSMQDIATGLGMKSRSNIHRVIHDLRRQGHLRLNPHKVRTVKLVDKSAKEMTAL